MLKFIFTVLSFFGIFFIISYLDVTGHVIGKFLIIVAAIIGIRVVYNLKKVVKKIL